MPVEDLSPAHQRMIAEEGSPRWEPPGTYHVTDLIGCLRKTQLRHWAIEAYSASPTRPLTIPSSLLKGSWPLFRGLVLHERFSDAAGGTDVPLSMPLVHTRDGSEMTLLGTNDWTEMRDGKLHIGELKTVKNTYWYLKHGPGDNHVTQGAAYLELMSRVWGKKIRDVAFVYADMDDVHVLPREYTNEEIEAVISDLTSRASDLTDAYNDNCLLPALNWKKEWECGYCPFTPFCHPEYPLCPPPEKPDMEKWYAGPVRIGWRQVKEKVPPEFVEDLLEWKGVGE